MKILKTETLNAGSKQITFLYLDGDFPNTKWKNVVIDGTEFKALYMSGAKFDVVPIDGAFSFSGKEIAFV